MDPGVKEKFETPAKAVVSDQSHMPILDALRGIAALAVCWFHYTTAQFTQDFGKYQWSGRYGYLGVQVFFVISGFVIPWSLYRSGYSVSSFFRFLARRIVRLDPPYLVSVFLVVSGFYLSSLTPGHAHAYQIPWPQVFAHLGYVNAFLGMPWLQMSYWSLAIEFQYYIFVGLTFALYARKGPIWLCTIAAFFGAASLIFGQNNAFLPHHLPLFLLGIIVFRAKCLNSSRGEVLLGFALASLLAWQVDGWRDLLAGLAACGAILFIHGSNRWLNFLGTISYSLYLIHVFVGDVVFGLLSHHVARFGILKWTAQFLALGATIVAAWVLYRIVELPSKSWSAKIRYGSRARAKHLSPPEQPSRAHETGVGTKVAARISSTI
jgi:peptidoglycan/LPS O-acetylase OafA/YrhL